MKKYGIILTVVFLVSVCSFSPAQAQEKTKEEKEKELQEQILEQKRAMKEHQKIQQEEKDAQDKLDRAIIIQKEVIDRAMEKVNDNVGRFDDPEFQRIIRDYRDNAKSRSFNEQYGFTPGIGDFYHQGSNSSSERTTWDFSKSIRESSFSRDYVFDVEPAVKSVIMSVSGDCKEGEIRIRIIMPNGNTFSEIVIDEFGNLNWRKSLTISETENQDKTGAWKIDIKSSKATGYFKIFFQAS